jgi:hypothetical protein
VPFLTNGSQVPVWMGLDAAHNVDGNMFRSQVLLESNCSCEFTLPRYDAHKIRFKNSLFAQVNRCGVVVRGSWGEPVRRLFAIQSSLGKPHAERACSSFSMSYSTRRIVGLGPSNNK